MEKILVVDDDESILVMLKKLLSDFNCELLEAETGQDGIQITENEHPDVIITDLAMPEITGLDILKRAKEIDENIPVIILTAHDQMTPTITAIQLGAFDYISKPLDQERFKLIVTRALESKRLNDKYSFDSSETSTKLENEFILVGNTLGIKDIFKQIGTVSVNKVTVLIQGETGTGKELIAKIIHNSGITKEYPFVAVNCSSLSETLLESELFGHVKGAFTGAIRDKKGKFELAGNGTIFLDEISEISTNLQVKLLRVIQEKEFEKVGGEKPIPIKARIITSTNRDLAEMVKQGSFRKDLYFRLKVVTIKTHNLNSRRADIPQLVIHLLAKINSELHKNVNVVQFEAMEMLQNYNWIGNVRELENILTQAVVLAKGNVLTKEHLILKKDEDGLNEDASNIIISLAEVEKKHIKRILELTAWNKTEAARILGIAKSTLYKKIEEFGLTESRHS
ncbi:MAG: sigma-54 dependent transcriptional regulator [Ignavibacteriaceae bacterium]